MSEDRAITGGKPSPVGEDPTPVAADMMPPPGPLDETARLKESPAIESGPPMEKTEGGTTNSKKVTPQKRKASASTGFAPSDINDGRERYDWATRYPEAALRDIRAERNQLFGLLYIVPTLMVIIWSMHNLGAVWLGPDKYSLLARYSYAWLGGMLGGTLFDLKWLYHSVAKGMWHQDRALWRLFTPHISGALAFSFILLILSNLLRIFDQATVTSSASVVAVSFMVGYFSDSAIAKLTEVAETLFGTTRKVRDKVAEENKPDQPATQPSKGQSGVTRNRGGKG